MTREGTVVNGVIVLDGPPPAAETREEFLESLRQSVAGVRAGVKGKPLAEFAAALKREFGTPPETCLSEPGA